MSFPIIVIMLASSWLYEPLDEAHRFSPYFLL